MSPLQGELLEWTTASPRSSFKDDPALKPAETDETDEAGEGEITREQYAALTAAEAGEADVGGAS